MTNPDLKGFYGQRIRDHGLSYRAMWGDGADWKSAERFAPLLQLPLKPRDLLVDIGCGTGDLAGFLKGHGVEVDYVGIEAVSAFAAEARRITGCEIVELDAFKHPDQLPDADWYVTFGTLNKDWSVADLPGSSPKARVFALLDRLFAKARKGIGCSLVTGLVDFPKDGVINIDPAEAASEMARLSPHFSIFHGYRFYEFFAAAWRDERR